LFVKSSEQLFPVFKRKSSFRKGLLVSTILLIDDDVQLAAAITELFELDGHAVITAHNGRQGLDRPHLGASPSLILLDLSMPEMDGWEFLPQKSADPAIVDIPTVVMSGSVTEWPGRCDRFLPQTDRYRPTP
jgi:response regulator RpfG family c-di-GMP phosphodiesterase